MTTQDTIKRTGDFIRNSATLKIFSIGILILVLLIPTTMISSLMHERESRRDFVVKEINQKWGNRQTITGPFLTIPYRSFYKDENGKEKLSIKYFHILPEKLKIAGVLDPHIRYRSIYEAVLYNAKISVTGNFKMPVITQTNIEIEDVLWNKAMFSIGITDMRGIQENIVINFNQKKYDVNAGLKTVDIATSGLSSNIPFSISDDSKSFSLQLNLNGSDQIHFVPLAEETIVEIKSSWASPSFNGSFLPVTRDISANGFSAKWNVLHLNRNFPQIWEGNQFQVGDASFGLRLLVTADIYQKSIRISKYAIMFIVFTFSAFFFSEIINKRRIHPIQYLLIGLAIILFYVLLLAISEHISFDYAYVLSAIAITLVITGYSKGIIKNSHFTLTVFIILTVLYSYLYIVLQLEDYALVMGSIGLLLVLSAVMYITRKIDWYSIESDQSEKNITSI